MADNYVGEIMLFAGNFEIQGWAFCNGQLLDIGQNQALFTLLGTTYGGDGQQTFAVPDLRGRAPVHQGQGPGLTPRVLGERVGEETVALQVAHYPAHSHSLAAATLASDSPPGGGVLAGNTAKVYGTGAPSATLAAQGVTAAPGGGQPHDNMAPFVAMNYLIALYGEFPPHP